MSMPGTLEERSLSDLTDYEVADLSAQVQAAEANKRPLLGPLEPISALAAEYKSETFLAKINQLEKDGWTGLRRSRGDGDCFYRGERIQRQEDLAR